jgi:SulP family sulfate permease
VIVVLLGLALVAGSGLAPVLAAFPLPILAALLAAAGLLHIGLARDLKGARDVALALVVAVLGFWSNLAVGLMAGLLLWWMPRAASRLGAWREKDLRPSRSSG